MNQPTPVTVRHTPGGPTVYVVAGHEFATPRAAIRAADAIDRHGRYVSPLRAHESPPAVDDRAEGLAQGWASLIGFARIRSMPGLPADLASSVDGYLYGEAPRAVREVFADTALVVPPSPAGTGALDASG